MSPAIEQPDEASECPQQERRRSTTWKAFNFKRQLSKVDVKLKTTFAAADKRGSIFYGAEEEEGTTEAVSPGNNEECPPEVGEECTENGSPKKEGCRPDNLVLASDEVCPVRPPRGNKRKPPVKLLQVRTEIKDLRDGGEDGEAQQQPPPTTSFMRRFSKSQLLLANIDNREM